MPSARSDFVRRILLLLWEGIVELPYEQHVMVVHIFNGDQKTILGGWSLRVFGVLVHTDRYQ